MEKYIVEITKEALQDMEDLYHYIAIDLLSPENALGQYNRIADKILNLSVFPEKFQLLESEPERSRGIRRMLVDNYSVFYTIKENKVIITDVCIQLQILHRDCKVKSFVPEVNFI